MCTPDSILQFEGKQCRFRQQRVYFRAKSLGDEGKKDLCKQWLVNLRREKTATTKLCPQNCRLLQRSQQAVQGIQHVLKRLTASLACATRAWKDNSELCHFAQKKTVFRLLWSAFAASSFEAKSGSTVWVADWHLAKASRRTAPNMSMVAAGLAKTPRRGGGLRQQSDKDTCAPSRTLAPRQKDEARTHRTAKHTARAEAAQS